MKLKLVIILLLAANLTYGQSYDTYKAKTDSTYVLSSSTDDEEATELTEDQALKGLVDLINNYYRLKNRKFQQWYSSDRIGAALEQDLKSLFPDTTYLEAIAANDSLFAHPIRTQEYDSQLKVIGDSTYNVEIFLTAGKNQVLRIEGDTSNTNYSVRFVEGIYTIRLGNNAKPLPFLTTPIELQYIKPSNDGSRYRTYYKELADRTKIRLRIKTP